MIDRSVTAARWTWAFALAIVPLVAIEPRPAIAEVTIRLVISDQPHVVVEGLSTEALAAFAATRPDRAAWQRVFALSVLGETQIPSSPVLGDYTVSDQRLNFTPRFPLKAGLRYRAVLDPNALAENHSPAAPCVETILSMPSPSRGRSTVVTAVYPSSDVLPENQLKFYIQFSGPMSRGESYLHIRLLDESGTPVEAPFLELAEELWDQSVRRLTLLLDPGRVKQDLKPHKEVGRAIAAGGKYALIISKQWRDASGERLASDFRKSFRVTKADVRQPDPHRWELTVPAVGTRQPLVVAFDEPLDHALLQHVLSVSNSVGDSVDGRVSVDENETRWRFQPAAPWIAGTHQLHIATTLEDLAGNSIARPFEVYLPSGRPVYAAPTSISFDVPSN